MNDHPFFRKSVSLPRTALSLIANPLQKSNTEKGLDTPYFTKEWTGGIGKDPFSWYFQGNKFAKTTGVASNNPLESQFSGCLELGILCWGYRESWVHMQLMMDRITWESTDFLCCRSWTPLFGLKTQVYRKGDWAFHSGQTQLIRPYLTSALGATWPNVNT